MKQSVTIRLTPTRQRLLKLFKKRHNLKKDSEAFELALRMTFEEEIDYRSKIERVAGCIKSEDDRDSVQQIRSLRDI
ncbi:MAG: hypothetical protein SVY10_07505 [Thermodesulfobacteriota bacterium]|nr:hypothetical protein [Thermodesulfobacteriota bacterium]